MAKPNLLMLLDFNTQSWVGKEGMDLGGVGDE